MGDEWMEGLTWYIQLEFRKALTFWVLKQTRIGLQIGNESENGEKGMSR